MPIRLDLEKQIHKRDISSNQKASTLNINAQILKMNCQLIIWAYQYYQNNYPSVSDKEYDNLYQKYISAIKTTDYKPFNDMSKQVGSPSIRAYNASIERLRILNEKKGNSYE